MPDFNRRTAARLLPPTRLRHPRMALALAAIFAALLAGLLAPRIASAAGTGYTVEDCGGFGNTGTFTFGRSNTVFTGTSTDCGNGAVGLHLGLNGASGNVALGDRAVWQFDAPPGETITGLGVEGGSYHSVDGWIAGWAANSVITPDPLPASDACVAQPQKSLCNIQSSGWFGIPNARDVELMIRCDETSTRSATYCANNPADASAAVGTLVVQLADPSPPAIAVGGSLWTAAEADASRPAWISGISAGTGLELSYSASNPSGICTLRATLTDQTGAVVADSTESAQTPPVDVGPGTLFDTSAPFRSRLPCGGASSGTGVFDPNLASLPTGQYRLNIEAQDPGQYQGGTYTYATGVGRSDGLPLAIDNSVPAVTIAPPAPGAGSAESVTVTATDASGSSGLAQLSCDVEGVTHSYPIAGDSATVQVPLTTTPFGGATDSLETVSCQASSVVGNTSRTSSLTLVRATARLVATISAGSRRVSAVAADDRPAALHLAHGQSARLSGRLIVGAGASPAGASVTVSQDLAGAAQATVLARVPVDSRGDFSLRLAPGPSRTLTLAFGGSPTLRTATAHAQVAVAGAVHLSLRGGRRAGRSVIVGGRVLGGHIPAGGVLVQLWYDVRGAAGWEPFGRVVRTAANGAFRLHFRVARGARGRRYRLRAVIAAQGGWPFLAATSNTVARTFR